MLSPPVARLPPVGVHLAVKYLRLAISGQNYLATKLSNVNKLANKSVIFHVVAKKSAVKQFFSISTETLLHNNVVKF